MKLVLSELPETFCHYWNNMMDFNFWENCPFKSNISSIKWIRLEGSIQSSSGGSVSAYHCCTSLQQLCLCITSAEAVVTNLWTVRWAEMISSLTCSSEGGVWPVSLQLCTELESIHFYLPVVKITSLFQSLSTVRFIWFCIQRFTAFEPYCITDLDGPLLSLKGWLAEIYTTYSTNPVLL